MRALVHSTTSAAALAVLFSLSVAPRPAVAETNVTVIASAAISGETESCGCKKKDLGGIPRRATIIQAERAKSDAVLLVDAGDFGSKDEFEPWMRTEFLWDSMIKLGYDAITPGPNELLMGKQAAADLFAKGPQVKVVSANITDKSGQMLWDDHCVVEKNGVRFGITGVTGSSYYSYNLTRGIQRSDDFDFQDVREALSRVVPTLKEKCDVVVVLLHTGAADAQRIVEEIPGMDVVVVGHNPGFLFNPERVQDSLVLRTGNRGQYLHVLDLTLEGGEIVEYNGESRPLGEGVRKSDSFETVVAAFDKKYNEMKGVEPDKAQSH